MERKKEKKRKEKNRIEWKNRRGWVDLDYAVPSLMYSSVLAEGEKDFGLRHIMRRRMGMCFDFGSLTNPSTDIAPM